jgi:mycothiol synthase
VSGLEWRGGLDEREVAAVRALVAAATEADGTAPVSEDVLLRLRDAANVLVHDEAGTLVAFAHLDEDSAEGAAELAVHPAHRRQGHGTRVVTALLERTAGRRLRVWAHGEHPGAAALAARYGFTRARALWQMRRSLVTPPIEEPQLPDGVRLRTFVVGQDEAEFLRVNNAAFDWHPEQGGWGVEQVKLREAEPWFDPAGFLLAVDADDRLLGFHWTKVHDGAEPLGEVYVLGVDPSARGLRLGSALTLAGLHHLRERGLGTVLLYVESDNGAAIRLYQGLGFTRWATDVSYVR